MYLTENKIQIWWKGKYSWVNAEQTRDQACLNLFYCVDHITINCSHPLIYELQLNIKHIFSCLMMHVIRISIILSEKQVLIRKRKFILEIDLKSRSNIKKILISAFNYYLTNYYFTASLIFLSKGEQDSAANTCDYMHTHRMLIPERNDWRYWKDGHGIN